MTVYKTTFLTLTFIADTNKHIFLDKLAQTKATTSTTTTNLTRPVKTSFKDGTRLLETVLIIM